MTLALRAHFGYNPTPHSPYERRHTNALRAQLAPDLHCTPVPPSGVFVHHAPFTPRTSHPAQRIERNAQRKSTAKSDRTVHRLT